MNDAEFLADRWVKSEVEQLSLVLVSAVDPVDRRDGIDLEGARVRRGSGLSFDLFCELIEIQRGMRLYSSRTITVTSPGPGITIFTICLHRIRYVTRVGPRYVGWASDLILLYSGSCRDILPHRCQTKIVEP
jgi:hypothetical protein